MKKILDKLSAIEGKQDNKLASSTKTKTLTASKIMYNGKQLLKEDTTDELSFSDLIKRNMERKAKKDGVVADITDTNIMKQIDKNNKNEKAQNLSWDKYGKLEKKVAKNRKQTNENRWAMDNPEASYQDQIDYWTDKIDRIKSKRVVDSDVHGEYVNTKVDLDDFHTLPLPIVDTDKEEDLDEDFDDDNMSDSGGVGMSNDPRDWDDDEYELSVAAYANGDYNDIEDSVNHMGEKDSDREYELSVAAYANGDYNDIEESVNHMGEREYQTFNGWKSACRKSYPGCGFRGDIDIAAATLSGKDVGEWDGAVGCVYNKEVDEGIVDYIRGKNYSRLANRSLDKVHYSMDKADEYAFSDPKRFPHEKEFVRQIDKMNSRYARASSLGVDTELDEMAKAPSVYTIKREKHSNGAVGCVYNKEVDEGIVDYIRGKNYSRLANRSLDKVHYSMDKADEYAFSDPKRFPHEKEFVRQIDKMNSRYARASSLGVDTELDEMAKAPSVYTIKREKHSNGSNFTMSGTLPELIEKVAYTLECGASYQHEKGNAKINPKPTNIKSLITNLNNAVNNSAANGYAGVTYSLQNNAPVGELNEAAYSSSTPYGVRYKVFAGREQRITTKEAWFKSSEARDRGVDKICMSDNFYELAGYSSPTTDDALGADTLAESTDLSTLANRASNIASPTNDPILHRKAAEAHILAAKSAKNRDTKEIHINAASKHAKEA
jgi:predicted CopG family antitoxin